MDYLLDKLGKAKFFTTLDLADKFGKYEYIWLEHRQKHAAFIAHHGLYMFKVMPFGIMNAPAVF